MRLFPVLGWIGVVVGIVLGCVALGLVGGPPAVLGFLAGVFVIGGIRLIWFDLAAQTEVEQ